MNTVLLQMIHWDLYLVSGRVMSVSHKIALFHRVSLSLTWIWVCDIHLTNPLHSSPSEWLLPIACMDSLTSGNALLILTNLLLRSQKSVPTLYRFWCFLFTKRTEELYPTSPFFIILSFSRWFITFSTTCFILFYLIWTMNAAIHWKLWNVPPPVDMSLYYQINWKLWGVSPPNHKPKLVSVL